MKKLRLLLLGLLLPISVFAAQPDAVAAKEIQQLLAKLESSGCQFNRNGSWYSAVEAKKHLADKYDYLLKKGWVTTAETFIERGATKSSMSGKVYQVKCGDAQAVSSAAWLTDALKAIRTE